MSGDIVINNDGGNDWVVVLIVGLVGALIGAFALYLVDVWRQVIQLQGALRAVRLNLRPILEALETMAEQGRLAELPMLSTQTWSNAQLVIAPHLEENALEHIARAYGLVDTIREFFLPVVSQANQERQEAVRPLLMKSLENLREVVEEVDSISLSRRSLLPAIFFGSVIKPRRAAPERQQLEAVSPGNLDRH